MTTCWHEGMKIVEVYRSPKIECIVHQHPWLESDNFLADIILPTNTLYEVDDIMSNTFPQGVEFKSVTLQRQAVEPIGESKSDYGAVCEVAKKLGMYEEYTEGKSIEEWLEWVYKNLGLPEFTTWEEFKKKEIYIFPTAKDWEKDPPGWRNFYEDPKKYPLTTPSGKLEFYSERLAQHFPGDEERPPIPKWIEKGVSHDERLSSKRAKKYPLLQMSNHPRWRTHAQCDDISWTREIPTCKVKGPDGYQYHPVWLHPLEAKKRGIKHGDIVSIYNDRGTVLGGAYITERIMPGVLYIDHGAKWDPIVPGEIDRGGAINTIVPRNTTSKNAVGHAVSGFLVEVEKTDMEALKRKYPEAFERPFHPCAGPGLEACIIGGK